MTFPWVNLGVNLAWSEGSGAQIFYFLMMKGLLWLCPHDNIAAQDIHIAASA